MGIRFESGSGDGALSAYRAYLVSQTRARVRQGYRMFKYCTDGAVSEMRRRVKAMNVRGRRGWLV